MGNDGEIAGNFTNFVENTLITMEQKYPVGIQTFSEIIRKGYTYVDKTGYIPSLTKHGKYVFLSRPRRFGKSLMLSTLKAYFEGQKDLFKGLALDACDVDWSASPVLHFDFNNGLYENASGLLAKLDDALGEYETKYGIPVGIREREEIPLRFRYLIHTIYEKTGKQVVILVDEYDKPLLAVENNLEVFEMHQTLLKSFYGNLKSMDSMIRYTFITGVARFSKVSIFSDLNHLDDISLADEFANICGWSEEELSSTFYPGIEELSKKRVETVDATLDILRYYYDGYLFTPEGSRLYNPFSVLRALRTKSIEPFWFKTGTPAFLVKRVRDRGIYPPDINGIKCSYEQLSEVGWNDRNPMPLMFQTGYLTIGSYDRERRRYTLRFPNYEVENGFYTDLLPAYFPDTVNPDSPFSIENFKDDLYDGRPEDFMKRLATLFKDLPGEDHCESVYRAITYLLATLCATRTIAEHHGYRGRSDVEVVTGKYIYLFEFKYNKSVREAMEQIYSRDYAGRYAMDSRTIYLIGADYTDKKDERGLRYQIEVMCV